MTQKLPDNNNNVRVWFEDGTEGIGYYSFDRWWIFAPQDNEWAKLHLSDDAPEDIFNRIYLSNLSVSSWESIDQKVYIPPALWDDATAYLDRFHPITEINNMITLLESMRTERGNILAGELASWKENKT